MDKLKNVLPLLVCIIVSKNLFSQDLKAGEINVIHITGNQYQAKIIFYYETSTFFNRPYLLLNWGDGTTLDTLQWDSFTAGCGSANAFTKNFSKTHNYLGDGNYLIYCVDSFRIDNIINIINSDLEKLQLQYNLIINSSMPSNNSPQSSNCLIDERIDNNWIYNAGAYDVDGDSLSYSIVSPQNLTNYSFPDYSINNLSGDFTLTPTAIGNYAICMKIEEWKQIPNTPLRSYMGSSYRNMLINANSLTTIHEIGVNKGVLSIYPNPAQTTITLEFTAIETKTVSIEIKNVLGQTIKTINNSAFTNGTNKMDVDVSELSSGVYFVRMQSDKQSISEKFIKQN